MSSAELLQKAERRIRNLNHLNAKDFALQTVFPLLRKIIEEQSVAIDVTDSNFRQIFMALHVANEESDFLDNTFKMVTSLHQFIDQIMLAAGFLVTTDEGILKNSDTIPSTLSEKITQFQQETFNWFQQYDAVRAAAEEELDDDDDEDDDDFEDDEDDDFDESVDDGEPVEENASEETPDAHASAEPSQEAGQLSQEPSNA